MRQQKQLSASSTSAQPNGRTPLGSAEVEEAGIAPQTNYGFLQLATGSKSNDFVLQLIAAQLSGVEWQIVMIIIRKTYGYKKKEDWISLSQFMHLSGRTRKGICIAILSLEKKNIIITRREIQKTFYAFNKKFSSWKIVEKDKLVYPSTLHKKKPASVLAFQKLVYPSTLHLVYPSTHTKENVTKENITKEILLHSDTVSLFDWLSKKCSSSKIKLKVNTNELDRIVDKFIGKIKMRNTLESYVTWMIDADKKILKTVDIQNCFARQVAYEKTRQLARQESKHEKMRMKR